MTGVKIVESAIKFPNGAIITGRRHGDCFHRYAELYEKRWQEDAKELNTREEQGFVTNGLRFVGREAALKIAIAAEQVTEGETHSNKILYSEDLY